MLNAILSMRLFSLVILKCLNTPTLKVITPIKFDEVDATNGALENDGKLNRYSNSVEETCKNLGLKDCFFSYTDDNFAQIQEYDQFRKLVRGRLYGINPGAPTSKMLALLSAKWRQFQNIRAKKYKKGGLLFSQKLKVSDPILKQKDLLNQSNEVKLKNKKLRLVKIIFVINVFDKYGSTRLNYLPYPQLKAISDCCIFGQNESIPQYRADFTPISLKGFTDFFTVIKLKFKFYTFRFMFLIVGESF